MKKIVLMLTMVCVIGSLFACSSKQVSSNVDVANADSVANEKKSDNVTESSESKTYIALDYALNVANKTIDPSIYLDYKAGMDAKVYKWIKSDDGKYFTFAYINENGEPVKSAEAKINVGANNAESIDNGKGMMGGNIPGGLRGMMNKTAEVLQGVYINSNITNLENQTMLIYAPAEYFDVDSDGNVTGINYSNTVNGYTAKTAPIVFLNECGGWRSSSPRSCETSYIEQGFVYVTCGARSRDAMSSDGTVHTGKAPMQIADLKSGVIELRANDSIIPGDKNKIISVGTSGGGQMSSILGTSGDMKEYYPYMYEAGTLGVTKNSDGTYSSAIPDSIFAAQNYCPIADIENADLAYAWWWVDLVDDGGINKGNITKFEKRLQELEADEYIKYLNALHLKDDFGNELTLTGLRSGSYYDAILNNLSDSLNQFVANGEIDVEATYGDYSKWLTKDKDGNYAVTDLRGFMIGTGLVNNRNKAIPGFDPMDKSAENDAFGKAEQDKVHFSKEVAKILKENYDELSKLEGFNKEQFDSYIDEALDGENAAYINNQTNLMNATHILLGYDGIKAVNPVKHFRNRSGTADQHTSFSVGFNIMLAAKSFGIDTDYALVWNMPHGSNEGTSTGTFIEWVNKICKE